MSSWVIDSSVAFAWVHPNQATSETDRLLDEVIAGGNFIVPLLWFTEVANALLVLERRKKLTAEERKEALATLSKLNLSVDEESGRAAFGKTSELAEKYQLSVYDATYLEVALRRRSPLASRDGALISAAKSAGLRVL